MPKLVFATRPSRLARWQTDHVAQALQRVWPDLQVEQVVITTSGDNVLDKPLPEIGGKGLFTHELEAELLAGRVDAAVHSLKDLPVEDTHGLTIGLIPPRGDARDVLITHTGHTLAELPQRARVGTSSLRRQAQLLSMRPDLDVQPIRGNVDTRIRKVQEGQYQAAVLAAAGVTRLGLDEHISQYFNAGELLPAPGQGALAVQCRADDQRVLEILQALEDSDTRMAVTAERCFLLALGGGCSLPVGAYAQVQEGEINLKGLVISTDGCNLIRLADHGTDAEILAAGLARQALQQGADEVLHG